jgi:hypothetical protein
VLYYNINQFTHHFNKGDEKMDYAVQINQIAGYLKNLGKELGEDECLAVCIKPHVFLYVEDNEIKISDEPPRCRDYEYMNSQYFVAFRDIPNSAARELILNWKSIKESLLIELQKLKDENTRIAAFEV